MSGDENIMSASDMFKTILGRLNSMDERLNASEQDNRALRQEIMALNKRVDAIEQMIENEFRDLLPTLKQIRADLAEFRKEVSMQLQRIEEKFDVLEKHLMDARTEKFFDDFPIEPGGKPS